MIKATHVTIITTILLCAVTWAEHARAEPARTKPAKSKPYKYVSLNALLPAAYDVFDPIKVTDRGYVYGTAYACPSSCVASVLVYHDGAFTFLHEGVARDVNERGVVGGAVSIDPDNGIEQAAIFRGDRVELIPRLSGELSSTVEQLTDSELALVVSIDAQSVATHYLYDKRKRVTRLDLGEAQQLGLKINDRGTITGTDVPLSGRDRAFRYELSSRRKEELAPTMSDPKSWSLDINRRGDVLGYSWGAGPERIGVWRNTTFQTYFVEGTLEFPTVSNSLLWNERGLIVITNTVRADMHSYLVRRDLSDLVEGLPAWTSIVDANEAGDLIGIGGPAFFEGNDAFLLERRGEL